MTISELKIGIKMELELTNSIGEKIGQTYISQLLDILDRQTVVIAAPIHESRLLLITTGTKIRLVFLHHKYGLLSFTGVISRKERRENIIAMVIRIESDFVKIQRRGYFRLDCNLQAKYYVQNAEEKIGLPEETETEPEYKKALTKNVSGNGACIVVMEEIPKNATIALVIQLTDTYAMKAVCKVVRCIQVEVRKEKAYELGLYFSKISQKDQDALIKYVFDQQRFFLKNSLSDKI